MLQSKVTLKALANSSPGLLQPWDFNSNLILFANSGGVREWRLRNFRQRLQRSDVLVTLIPRVAATLGWNWPTLSA